MDHFQRIFLEQEKFKSELDLQSKEIKWGNGKGWEKCEAQNENKRKKLIGEKKKNAMIINNSLQMTPLEQKQTWEDMLRFPMDQMLKSKLDSQKKTIHWCEKGLDSWEKCEAQDNNKSISHEQEKLKSESESQRKEIEWRSGKGWDSWEKCEARNESENIFHEQEKLRSKFDSQRKEIECRGEGCVFNKQEEVWWHGKGCIWNDQENGWRREKGWDSLEKSEAQNENERILNEQENGWGRGKGWDSSEKSEAQNENERILNEQENGWQRGKGGETREYQIENPWKKHIDEKKKGGETREYRSPMFKLQAR